MSAGVISSALFEALRQAKLAENVAKAKRVELEEKIAALVPDRPEQGSRTLVCGEGRVTVKWGVNVKADVDAIRNSDVPPDLLPLKLVPASYEFDPKRYEELRASHPDVFRALARHVVSKPAKPSLTLKV